MRTLEKNDANQRLDKFLQKRFKTLPKSLMYKYIRKKCIKVNGKKCDIQTMLKEGDVLTFYIKDEFFEASEQKNYEFMKAPKTFDIVYEDENLILIDKKPGIIVHPDRIDRNTGGIVIAAKNADSLRILNAKMKTRELEKYYLCLLYGKPKRDSDTLHGYMTKNESKNKVTVFKNEVEGSKEIKTKYEILDFNGKFSLAEVELLTGRTHQIRAQFASRRLPLVGDGRYGGGSGRLALFACGLEFTHPISGERMSFSALPPTEEYPWNEFDIK